MNSRKAYGAWLKAAAARRTAGLSRMAGLVLAGALGLGLLPAGGFTGEAQAAPPMTFRLEPTGNVARCGTRCLRVIVAEGEIDRGAPERFLRFVWRHRGDKRVRAVIFINSPGGLVVASMKLGLLFRKLGAAVVVARVHNPGRGNTQFVSARCYSACVYAIMGARKRVIPPSSRIVVHRMYAVERFGSFEGADRLEKTYRNDKLYKQLQQYARRMGVSSRVIDAAERVAPNRIKVLSQREIRRWRLGVPNF